MQTKQQNFVKSTRATSYEHFKNIHSSIAHPKNRILSQLLYSCRSSDDASQRLFLMAEQEFEDCPMTFTYLALLQDEVSYILPVLPLILMGRLGKEAHAWFLPTDTLGIDEYRYYHDSTASNRLISTTTWRMWTDCGINPTKDLHNTPN
jgi:hypothetical protein